jgi:hypothetical protein
VLNDGIGDLDIVSIRNNAIDCDAQENNIEALLERGVTLLTDCP